MTTPEQLLERLEAVERGATGPPTGAGERVWGAIEARLVNGPAPPELDQAPLLDEALLDEAAELAATNAGGSGSVVLKIVGALAVIGAVGGGLALLARDPAPEPVAANVAVEPEQPAAIEPAPEPELPESPEPELPEPQLPLAPELPEPEPIEPETPAKPATTKVKQQLKPPAPAKTLADEVALMQAISTALKQGHSAKVLTLVAEHERDFGKGQFVEERRAAKARALCKSGKQAAGEDEAASFASRWPGSIHLTSVKQDCGLE